MGEIIYKNIHEFGSADLKELFPAVVWFSGQFPNELAIAEVEFYESCGFEKVDDTSMMFIMDLGT